MKTALLALALLLAPVCLAQTPPELPFYEDDLEALQEEWHDHSWVLLKAADAARIEWYAKHLPGRSPDGPPSALTFRDNVNSYVNGLLAAYDALGVRHSLRRNAVTGAKTSGEITAILREACAGGLGAIKALDRDTVNQVVTMLDHEAKPRRERRLTAYVGLLDSLRGLDLTIRRMLAEHGAPPADKSAPQTFLTQAKIDKLLKKWTQLSARVLALAEALPEDQAERAKRLGSTMAFPFLTVATGWQVNKGAIEQARTKAEINAALRELLDAGAQRISRLKPGEVYPFIASAAPFGPLYVNVFRALLKQQADFCAEAEKYLAGRQSKPAKP
jgi:hypothetical protein